MERRLTAILAADVVGYSRLMGADEAGTLAALKAIRTELINDKIAGHQGRIIKLTGDGMLVEFPSIVNAVACAAEVQHGMRKRNSDVPQDRRIEFRVGVNLGDVIVEGDDIYGDGVNVAVRLESIAPCGGIAVSQSVRDHVGNRLELAFEDRGEQNLKNIEKPIRVYHVLFEEPAARVMLPSEEDKPSIIVLPFNNMSGDPEQEYFSDGITEDIITDLSKVSGLFVVARHTAFTYKGKPLKVEQVGRDLGVAFVLEGSVRKAGARVRVTAQLINAIDGGHIWAERFDRDLIDIFAIQDEITHAIVEQLKVKLLLLEKKSIEQAPTDNIEAYTYYLRGRQYLRRGSKAYYQLARQMFSKAVELDPLYARAYAGIADCDSFLFQQTVTDITIDNILATSSKAIALDDSLAEAHASQGFALQLSQRPDEAVAQFEKAISLDPNSFEANYFYGRASFEQGQHKRAAALFAHAADIKSDDYQSLFLLSMTYRSLGREQESKDAARKTLERAERELVRHPADPRPASAGGSVLIDLGETERAREWIGRSLAIAPDDILTQYNAACAYSRLGDSEAALDLLERALRSPAALSWRQWIEHDPDFNPIRSHPRFQKIVERIGKKS
jgi:adenylate cyclase